MGVLSRLVRPFTRQAWWPRPGNGFDIEALLDAADAHAPPVERHIWLIRLLDWVADVGPQGWPRREVIREEAWGRLGRRRRGRRRRLGLHRRREPGHGPWLGLGLGFGLRLILRFPEFLRKRILFEGLLE